MKGTQETHVRSLGQEDPLENEMATHYNILTQEIPWTEKPDRLPWGHKESDATQQQTFFQHLLLKPYTVKVRNRFKGLDLIDRVPDELWNEVCDIVQETVIKTISMEKKCKKLTWLSGEALQIAVKRTEVKSKGEKERYKHLNAEFQRRARKPSSAINAK